MSRSLFTRLLFLSLLPACDGDDAEPLLLSAKAGATGGVAPFAARFEATATGGRAPLSFVWSFGDGATEPIQSPSHTYSVPGKYVATCQVSDVGGSIASASVEVEVTDDTKPRVTLVASPTLGPSPLEVKLEAVVDGGDAPLAYQWSYGDGTSESSLGPSATHAFSAAGRYGVVLAVSDAEGDRALATAEIDVVAPEGAPIAIAIAMTTSCSIPLLENVQLDASDSTDPDGDALTYEWIFVGIPPRSSPRFNNVSVVSPSLITDVDGTYEVRVFVSDGENRVASDVLAIESSGVPASVTGIAGEGQVGEAGSLLPTSPEVEVRNACGAPLPGAVVVWRGSNASPTQRETRTNEEGRTSSGALFGRRVGTGLIRASSGEAFEMFTVGVTAGPAAMLLIDPVPRSPISATTGVVIGIRLTDQFQNSVTGPDVMFDADLQLGRAEFDSAGSGIRALSGISTTNGVAEVTAFSTSVEATFLTLRTEPGITGAARQVFLREGFEGATDRWQLYGANQNWEIGAPTSGPGGAHTGDNVLATNLDGDFSSPFYDRDIAAVSAPLDNPFGVISAEVSFWHWYDMGTPDPCTYGAGLVLWEFNFMNPEGGYPGPGHCVWGDFGFGGRSDGWVEATMALPFPFGSRLDFWFSGNVGLTSANVGPGWYIDDIELRGLAAAAHIRFAPGEPAATVALASVLTGTTSMAGGIAGTLPSCPGLVTVRALDAFGNRIHDAGIGVDVVASGSATFVAVVQGTSFTTSGNTASAETNDDGQIELQVTNTIAENVTFSVSLRGVANSGSSIDIAFADGCPALEICLDNLENNMNGRTDCEDSACYGSPECESGVLLPAESCNGIDDGNPFGGFEWDGYVDEFACRCISNDGCDGIANASGVTDVCLSVFMICVPNCNQWMAVHGYDYCATMFGMGTGFCQASGECGF